jgi:hypothetical protein
MIRYTSGDVLYQDYLRKRMIRYTSGDVLYQDYLRKRVIRYTSGDVLYQDYLRKRTIRLAGRYDASMTIVRCIERVEMKTVVKSRYVNIYQIRFQIRVL